MRRLLVLTAAALAFGTAPAFGSSVAGVGYNAVQQLGPGYKNGFEVLPVSTVGLPAVGVKEIASFDDGTLLVTVDGTVLYVGGDQYGQCGCGVKVSVIGKPVRVRLPRPAVQITAAGGHGMALLDNGQVYSWGGNLWGTLGNGTSTHGAEVPGDYSSTPLLVALPPVRRIAAGGGTDVVQLADGSLMAWGEGKTGQLGTGNFLEQDRPVPVTVVGPVVDFAIGGLGGQGGHVLAQTAHGLVAYGANGQGQLGDGTTKTSVLPVPVRVNGQPVGLASSVSHNLARMADGTVQAWGGNGRGELGVPTTENCAKAGKPTLPCSRLPVTVAGLSGVSQVAASFAFSVVVAGERAYSFGWNEFGQLGLGNRQDSPLPAQMLGVGGIQSVSLGGHNTMMMLAGAGPAPTISVTAGSGSLAVAWRSAVTSERWTVAFRPVKAKGWTIIKPSLPGTVRSTVVAGLTPGVEYQVYVKNAGFGTRIVAGVPLP